MFRLIIVFTLFFALMTGCDRNKQAEIPPKVPISDFFRNPSMSSFQISSSGEYIAFLKPWKGRKNIFVQKIGEDQENRITASTDRDINKFFWGSNDVIIYIQDTGGNEFYHLIAVNRQGGEPRDLTPLDSINVRIVSLLEENPQEILVRMNLRQRNIFDVYRLNIIDGRYDMVAQNPGQITSWIADWDGKIRLALSTDGVKSTLLYRQKESQPFHEVITTNYLDMVYPIAFTFDNRYVYAFSSLNRNTDALVRFDMENAREAEILFEDPEVDVNKLFYSRKRRVITGVAVIKDRVKYHFFDEKRKLIQKTLQRHLPGQDIWVEDTDRDENRIIARTSNDRTRGAYYYLDMTSGEFRKLADVSPWLKEEYMAAMTPVKFLSRDSLTIRGYLTLPVGRKAQNLPVVVYPHGGPWYRDRWEFNPVVQFLANRGYAVFQVNYRGSVGYGKSFWMKGFKQWGGAMQDDLTDGVKWLIDQGIADSSRIAIFGHSFGGFMALRGLIKTPDLYNCGVSYVGITNIFTYLNDIPPAWENYREMIYEMVGDPQTDANWLKENSPFFHADEIRVPVFIAQGANDPKVDEQETEQMIEKMRSNGIEIDYMIKENEGHGYLNEENRIELYSRIEKFLERNNK